LIKITVDGGAGSDTILGSNGADLLLGGDGDDFLDGQQGNDSAFLGPGTTRSSGPGRWQRRRRGPGRHRSAPLQRQCRQRNLRGSANGQRVRFTRNVGNIVLDLNHVERVDLERPRRADTIIVNHLAGTDLTAANIVLRRHTSRDRRRRAADIVIVNGTTGNDTVEVVGTGTSYTVLGLSSLVFGEPVRRHERFTGGQRPRWR